MRKPILFVTAVAAFSIMVMSAVSLAMSHAGETPPSPVPEAEQTAAAPQSAAPSEQVRPVITAEDAYLLREQNGVIVVCRPDTPDSPEQITDIEVGALRFADQKSLEEGIPVSGHENLLRLLEDFCP